MSIYLPQSVLDLTDAEKKRILSLSLGVVNGFILAYLKYKNL